MEYTKQEFVDGQVLTAEHLNHMETGIQRACDATPPACNATDCSKVLSYGENGLEWVDMPTGGGDGDGVGQKTEQGGEIFNDYETNEATAEFATAFGSENTAAGDCSIAGGKRIFKSGAEYVADEWLHGEAGYILKIYIADPDGEYAKNTISFEEAKNERYESGSTHECWRDVSEWLIECEEYDISVPDILMVSDGRFCLLEDLRYNEAYGKGAMAIGKGAVAYSRASKSFGYRTQTGYPPSLEHAETRPEAIVQTDENGNPVYPADNVGQAAFAIGADTAALNNHDFAGGWGSVARGQNSLAFGDHNEASGYCAISLGHKTKATGYAAVAVGDQCEATKENCFAGGSLSKSTAGNSIAFGYGCTASTRRTVALGSEANASGEMGATAIGHQVTANGKGAIAMGSGSTAKGEGTFAVGVGTQATLYGAFAYGDHCESTNYNAIAGGANSKAKHANTGAIGRRVVTGRSSQFVVGQDNAEDASALFVVGNGTSDTNRMNAFVVNAAGSAKLAGALSADGATFKKTVTMDGGVMCWGQATFLSGLEISGKLTFDSIDSTSRQRIFTKKTSAYAPDASRAGDYIGQLWTQENDAGEVIAVYMYCGYTSATGGKHKWIKLG